MITEKGENSRERIVKAATAMFARKGYAGTGMRELAEAAEVNPAMINYFFGSKKELLKLILDTFFSGYLEVIEQELAGSDPLEVKVRRFIDSAVKYIAANRDYTIIALTELPHEEPEVTAHRAIWAGKAMQFFQQEVCLPLEQATGYSLSPAFVGPLLTGMMTSRFLFEPVMEHVKPPGYGEEFFQQYPDMIAGIFLNGIIGLKNNKDEEWHGGSK